MPYPYDYSWEAGQSKQVVYQTANDHIHELSVVKGGAWQHADLTAITGAPPAVQLIKGYSWSMGMGRSKSLKSSKQVTFKTADDHIHELYMIKGGTWQHADLTAITGAPPAASIKNAYSWGAGQSKQVVYWTTDRHIHELYVVLGGTWQHADLTAITKAPPFSTLRNGYSWSAGKSKQVTFTTADDHIHELSVVKGGTWPHAVLTAITGAPPARRLGDGYSWEAGQSKQITFQEDQFGPFHELSVVKGGMWQHADLTAISGDPILPNHTYADGAYDWGYVWEMGQSKQMFYRPGSGDSHLKELFVVKGGTWQHADLTAITGAPPIGFGLSSDNPGYSWKAGQSKQFVYLTTDHHIHELYVVKGGAWQHADLTAITGAPPAKAIRNAYSWEAGQSKQVTFETDDGHIHELYVVKGGAWQHADLTAITGAPPADH
mgnify:FL=1